MTGEPGAQTYISVIEDDNRCAVCQKILRQPFDDPGSVGHVSRREGGYYRRTVWMGKSTGGKILRTVCHVPSRPAQRQFISAVFVSRFTTQAGEQPSFLISTSSHQVPVPSLQVAVAA